MELLRNPGLLRRGFPDCAIGRRVAPIRLLHPGYGLYLFESCSPDGALAKSGILAARLPDCASLHPGYGHALIFVTFIPIGWPKISDSVRQWPSLHSRHSPAAPELPSTSSGIAARFGSH